MASILKHLRSSTADKRPTASGLADGQIALNTASGTPAMFFKDSAGNIVKVGPAHIGTTAPNVSPAGSAGNSDGELWIDESLTTRGLKYYDGTAFINLTPSGTTSTVGLVELATDAETQAGTDNVRVVTPSGLQSKISDSTSTTSSTTIASSTAVKSAFDLANAALPKAGGTLTGELLISPSGSLVFEGSSDDSFETTIAVTNPTADRTITFPNVTGNVVTTGDSGTVTSTMILDDTIVNADINSAAAIAHSKLANITAGSVLLGNASNVPTATALSGDVTINSSGVTAISAGVIVNADINASAAIVDTKLDTIATADKVSLSALNIDGATDIGGALENGDLFIVDDGAGGTNRKAQAFRMAQLTYSGVTGDITVASGGTAAISAGVIVNADVNASAAIAGTKISPDFGSQTITTTGVVSAALGAAATPSLTFTGDLNTGIYSPGADQLAISTGGSGRLFVDADGEVGIGTGSPDGLLTLAGANSNVPRFRIQHPSSDRDAAISTYFDGSGTYLLTGSNHYFSSAGSNAKFDATSGSSAWYLDGSGVGIFYNSSGSGSITERFRIRADGTFEIKGGGTAGSSPAFSVNPSASANSLVIDSSGRLGVGTSSPVLPLTVAGAIAVGGAGNNGIQFYNASPTATALRWLIANNQGDSDKLSIYRYDSSGNFAGTPLVIDSSNRVGIGTSGPSNRLHIQDTSGNAQLRLTGTGGYAELYSDGNFYIQPNGSTKMVVQSGGNVGIGSTSPQQLLHVDSGSGGANAAITLRTTGYSGNQFNFYAQVTPEVISVIESTERAIAFKANGSERARIDSSGRFLVGTSSAATTDNNANSPYIQLDGTGGDTSRLLIRCNADTTPSQGPVLYLSRSRGTTANSKTAVAADDLLGTIIFEGTDGTHDRRAAAITAFCDGGVSTNDMPGRLVFSTTTDGASSPTERMRINNAGNMSFNGTDVTVTTGNVGQIYKFFGGANNTIMALESTGANRFGVFEYRRSGRSGNARTAQISLGENASNQGVIDIYSSAANADVSGGVTLANGATSWSSISDIRLKNVVSHFDDALADVSTLDAFRFTWKSDTNATPQVGLSAQSVQAVLPEAIANSKLINASEDDDTEYLSVRYTEVIPLLVAALQESKKRIETLEAEVAALKAQ